jgi:hypothetical protein
LAGISSVRVMKSVRVTNARTEFAPSVSEPARPVTACWYVRNSPLSTGVRRSP